MGAGRLAYQIKYKYPQIGKGNSGRMLKKYMLKGYSEKLANSALLRRMHGLEGAKSEHKAQAAYFTAISPLLITTSIGLVGFGIELVRSTSGYSTVPISPEILRFMGTALAAGGAYMGLRIVPETLKETYQSYLELRRLKRT
jgi:hypothetical protein